MRRSPLFWKIFLFSLLAVISSLLLSGLLLSRSIRKHYISQTYRELKEKAELISFILMQEGTAKITEADKSGYLTKTGKSHTTRITLILPNGEVIYDSHQNHRQMENQAGRPEVMEALKGNIGSAVRYSQSLKAKMLYVALPVKKGSKVAAVVRTSTTLETVNDAIANIRKEIFSWSLIAAFVVGILSLLISRRMSKPIESLTDQVLSLQKGETGSDLILPESSPKELYILASAITEMNSELSERMRIAQENQNRLKAILSSMSEGVIAVDSNNRIVVMNEAAGRLLKVDPDKATGQFLEHTVREVDILELTKHTRQSSRPGEKEIIRSERTLHARSAPLQGLKKGESSGVLIVLNDITDLRRVEKIRKDFVANVSHELKTPITTIKGFTETLLEGAVNDSENALRFLHIILNHANRMERIIEDLLVLSRLEQDEQRKSMEFGEVDLARVVRDSVAACIPNAEQKKIQIEVKVPEHLWVRGSMPLLEQALINLLDNAIKYSDPGKTVYVNGRVSEQEVVVSVKDQGCGIEKEHIPRIFERFYRVDKARSRKLGGTGLGLAIVRHVALLHLGHVEVESTPGEGSTFSLHIPALK